MKILNESDYQSIKRRLLLPFEKTIALSFLNPYSYYMIRNSEQYVNMDGYFIDGMLLKNCLAFKYGIKFDRLSFDYSSFAGDFIKFCEQNELSISFIGGTEEEMRKFSTHLNHFYPKLKITLLRNGYFPSPLSLFSFLSSLIETDVVILGLGAPLQEQAALIVKNNNLSKLVITCGGFISQTAARDDYYYAFVKKFNLRWLQRVILHPHVRRKFLSKYPIFLIKFSGEFFYYKIQEWKRKF